MFVHNFAATDEIEGKNIYNCSREPTKMFSACQLTDQTKRYKDVNLIVINHILKPIKNTQTVVMGIRLFVVMMISIQNQYKYIEAKRLCTNSWKIC